MKFSTFPFLLKHDATPASTFANTCTENDVALVNLESVSSDENTIHNIATKLLHIGEL